MKKIANIFLLLKSRLNKYWVAVIFFMFFTFVVGESTLFKRIAYNRQINQLEKDIEYYTNQKVENIKKIEALRSDNESLEKLAREQYQMVKSDEELFLIKD